MDNRNRIENLKEILVTVIGVAAKVAIRQNCKYLCNRMDAVEFQLLKTRWEALCKRLSKVYGEEPDLQALLFLIGVQELGRGPQKFSKDEKQDLMHIAVCRLLSTFGYYKLVGLDQDGWPHWELEKKLPPLTLKEQDWLLKEAAVEYFANE